MTTSLDNVTCVWYPSGGFGHFVNALLMLHGTGYARPMADLEFSNTGDSHSLPLMLPKYLHNPQNYVIPHLDPALKHTVLIDNGINDESIGYRKTFPGAKTLKLCYSDRSWPIVARTMIEKAMVSDLSSQVAVDAENWPDDQDWAVREKYFLYLRDHPLRHNWRPSEFASNVMIDDLLDYNTMLDRLKEFDVADTFRDEWQRWRAANAVYIDPIQTAVNTLSQLSSAENITLPPRDLWTQAVVNYYIWLEYAVEVPANDYSDWFTDTKQIVKMLNDHGVNV